MNYRLERPFLLLVSSVLLAGCITSTEQVAQRNNERCAARGLQPNTDAFSNCILALEGTRDIRMENRRRDLMEQSNVPAAATR